MENFNQIVNDFLEPLEDQYISNFLQLFLVLYAGLAAPKLPRKFLQFLDVVPIQIFVLFLVVWKGTRDPSTSLIVAVALFVSVNTLAGRGTFETFLIEQNTNVKPDCLGVTLQDILNVFDGDSAAMHQALYNVGVPANVEIDDYSAPILATYLANHGYQITGKCGPPAN
jgi:uncharacterized membrane protein YjdF